MAARMKRAGLCVVVGLLALAGCKKDAGGHTGVPPWQWAVTGMKPGSVAAEPSLVVCEADGSACKPRKAGVTLAGNKLIRLERGVSQLSLDAATRVDVAEGSELLLRDFPRTLEVRAGGIALSRGENVADAGPLVVKLVDAALELVGRTQLVARLSDANRGELFVTRGVVKATSPTTAARELHPGEGALVARAAPPDLGAIFAGKVSRFRQAVLAVAHPPPPVEVAKEPRGLGTMTARAPGTTAVVGGVRLAEHHVRAVVRDGVAQTEVEEVFKNDTGQVLEGRYVFPLPADATISGLSLFVNDKPVDGELVEKKRAAAIFKGIVEDTVRPRDPALLEWVKGSEFSLKVFPLPAHGSRKVVLRYQQVLTADGPSQSYVYPLSFGAERRTPIDDLSIDVELSDGGQAVAGALPTGYPATVSTLARATHVSLKAINTTPDHDFAIGFRRAAPGAILGSAEQGFVAMRLRAELPPGAQTPPFQQLDRVVVLDASQSQSADAFAATQRLAFDLLRSLEPDEQFALLVCDSACEAFPKAGLSKVFGGALSEAQAFIGSRKPAGSSDLAGALKAAAERVPPGGAVQVVYLGDGAPSAGELSVPSIVSRVRSSFEQRKVDLRLLGAGSSVDEVTLGGLAQQLSGSYDAVSTSGSLEEASETLTSDLRTPLVVAPSLEVPGNVTELTPRSLPNLRLGQELVVVGKYDGTVPFNVTLKGRLGGAPYNLLRAVGVHTADGALPFAARLWAEQRIRELQTSNAATAVTEVVDLSKRFRVMSRETSWLVLENEQMFAEFGITRTRPTAPETSSQDRAALATELDRSAEPSADASSAPLGAPASKPSSPAKRAEAEAPPPAAPASPPAPAKAGSAGDGLSGIGSSNAGPGAGSGSSGQVAGPRGNASVGGVAVSGGTVSNAARVVAGMRAGFRACYQRGLAENPTAAGTVRLTLQIAPSGQVAGNTMTSSGNLPASVLSCVQARARAAQFDPPSSGNATIVVPVTFVSDSAPNPPIRLDDTRHFDFEQTDVASSRAGDDKWLSEGQNAIDKLEADLRAAPDSRKKHEALVRGLLLNGRFAAALAAANRFVQLDPDLATARELLAYAAIAVGDRALASAAVDALVENAPTEAKAQGRAARAFEALGDEARACAHWRSLAELLPTSDSALFEALRCRARVLGDRDAALRDARAVSKPGPLLQKLGPLLESGQIPAFGRSSGSAGQLETTLTCSPAADCPYVIVITPTGTVFSPWTPGLGRSSPTSFAFSGLLSGVYRVLLVGGAPSASGQVEVRALNARNTFPFAPGHPKSLAFTQVTIRSGGGIIRF